MSLLEKRSSICAGLFLLLICAVVCGIGIGFTFIKDQSWSFIGWIFLAIGLCCCGSSGVGLLIDGCKRPTEVTDSEARSLEYEGKGLIKGSHFEWRS